MDNMIDIFFKEVFTPLDRDSLLERRCRSNLLNYLNAIIEASMQTDGLTEDISSVKVIRFIVRRHKEAKHNNSGICPMGKHHNILYIAAALCREKHIEDSDTVCLVLDEIYHCENTFERLFLGALFGQKAGQFFYGWKSDYESKEASVDALIYFIQHATSGKRKYKFYSSELFHKNKMMPFVDLPLDCCSKSAPLRIALRLGIPDLLALLLQYGANPSPSDKPVFAIEDLLQDMTKEHGSSYNHVKCLKILLRAIPSIPLRKAYDWYNLHDMRKSFFNRFPYLLNSNLVPESRCGKTPPELKHLCRCVTRKRLTENFQLPIGIKKLGLSRSLQNYLNLLDN